MPDVRLPDGTIVKNVPEGTTQKQVMERVRRLKGQQARAGIEQKTQGSTFLGTKTPGAGDPVEGAVATTAFGETAFRNAQDRLQDVVTSVQNLTQQFVSPNDEAAAESMTLRALRRSEDKEALRRRESELGAVLPKAGQQTARTVGRFAPDVAAGFGVFGAMRSVTGRILGETALGGVEGMSIEPFAATADMVQNMAMGSGAGLLLGTFGETQDMFRLFATGGAVGQAARVRNLQTEDVFRPTERIRLAGFDKSIGESGRSNSLRQVEEMLGSPGGPKEQFVLNRTKQVINRFDEIARSFNTSDLSFDTALEQSFRVYDDSVREIQNRAGDAFREALRPGAFALGANVAKDGTITRGRAVIPLNNFTSSLERQATALEEAFDNKAAAQIRQQIADIEERGGTVTLGGLQTMLKDLSEQASGVGTAATRAATSGSRVQPSLSLRALYDDLEDAASNLDNVVAREGPGVEGLRDLQASLETPGTPGGVGGVPADPRQRGGTFDAGGGTQPRQGTGPEVPPDPARGGQTRPGQPGETVGVQARERFQVPTTELDMSPRQARMASESLRAARDAFRREIAPVNALKKTGIDTLLGGERLLGVDEFTDTFMGLPFTQKKKALDLLDTRRPELANTLRQGMWLEVLERHRKPLPGRGAESNEVVIDIRAMARDLTNDAAERELFLLLPRDLPESTLRQARAGLEEMAELRNTGLIPEGAGASQTGTLGSIIAGLREKSINFVSQDPGFLARMLTGEAGPHVIERWLFTREGLEALARVREPKGFRGAKEQAALVTLLDLAVNAEEDKQALRALAAQQAEEAQARQVQQGVESRGRF